MISVIKYKEEQPIIAEVLNQFNAVIITDSITLSLPDKLEEYHKGLGGTNATSAMKIQASYDIKSKTFRKIATKDNARENDAGYNNELIESLKPNELSIADLGYYSVGGFIKIAKKGAYYISKIKSNTIIYTVTNEPIDMESMLKKSNGFIDMPVIIKGEAGTLSIKVRLCGLKLPSEVYAERLRKAYKKNSNKTLTKDEKERLKWILIVTNIPKEKMNCEAICETYRIRWQIELIFKSWRSHFTIDKINNIGKNYWDCLLYGKLVVITMLTSVYSRLYHNTLQSTNRRVSYLRFMKNICEDLNILSDFWLYKISEEQVDSGLKRIIRASLVEKRIKRKTTEQLIEAFDIPSDFREMISDFAA